MFLDKLIKNTRGNKNTQSKPTTNYFIVGTLTEKEVQRRIEIGAKDFAKRFTPVMEKLSKE